MIGKTLGGVLVGSLVLGAVAAAAAAAVVMERDQTAAPPPPGKIESPAPSANRQPHEGTRRMAQRLADLAASIDPRVNPFDSTGRVRLARATPPPADPNRRLLYDLSLATELLNSGETSEALEIFQSLEGRIAKIAELENGAFGHKLHEQLAVSALRLGEQENCIRHHGIDSCLLPIRGSGIHRETRGSRLALGEYSEMLQKNPNNWEARWLLNIASMTLGEYPAKVPPAALIPPGVFESAHDIKRFYDASKATGLDITGLAGGALMDDFDGDGLLDVIASSMGLTDQLRYFRNSGDGRFEERTNEAGLTGIVGGLNMVHADYDNDGDLDVVVLRGGWMREAGKLPNSLLRNNGDGTFDDVTEEAGLLSFHPTQAAAWGDYDNDGWLDLFIANETQEGETQHPNQLYRNNRNGTFTDVAAEVGLAHVGYFKGVVAGDYDNDGWLDLYVTGIAKTPSNHLYRNQGRDAQGKISFRDMAAEAGVREPARSFPTLFFDFNNDGLLDIFVSGYAGTSGHVAADYMDLKTNAELPRLYRNRGDGTFADVTAEMGLATVLLTMGINFGDLDNDGWLDFYATTGAPEFTSLVPNRMFRNAGGRTFQDVTTSGGFGHLQKGHGVAFGDIDNDGDQDIFHKIGGAYTGDRYQSALFENPGHGNHWIALRLVGTKSNRSAIGAQIKLTVDEPSGPRDIYVTVGSGGSFGGSSLQQEIGIGGATSVRRLQITWPGSRTMQVFENVAADRFLTIREDAEEPVARQPRRIDLTPTS